MDTIELLKERIAEEKQRKKRAVVFWYDESAQENVEDLQKSFMEETIQVRELTKNNFFSLKIEIEMEHKEKSFLLYAPFAKPADEDNFLIDMLLYSAEFKADKIAILAEQLRVNDAILRPIVQKYTNFFNSNERREKLYKVLQPNASERDLEYGMLAVLTNAPIANIDAIARHLLIEGIDEKNDLYNRIDKYFSTDRMWILFSEYFGMGSGAATQSLHYLLELLLFAHFQRHALFENTDLAGKYATTRSNACALFVDDWLRSKEQDILILESYIKEVEQLFRIRDVLQQKPIELFDQVSTFPIIDVLLVEKLSAELLHQTSDLTAWKERIEKRRQMHWTKRNQEIISLYDVLYEAVRLTEYKTFLKQYDTRQELYVQYTSKLYLIDQAYRRFMAAYINVEHREYVEPLVELLTNWFENTYLRKIAEETNYLLDNESRVTMPKQSQFFKKNIQPILEKESTRIFVIISDALRYEIGAELTDRFNARANGEASISPMLASLPSYTQLGMASLLPHHQLSIAENKTVLADGQPTNGLVNRTKILQNANENAVAYRLDEFMEWSRQEVEEQLKGKRLVYLYHDIIDATGDSMKSEHETYEAADRALDALERAIDRLSRLQAKRIFVTADHGFLFQYPKIEADVKLDTVQGDIIDSNRRFAIGSNLIVPAGAVKLQESFTPIAGKDIVIAKGVNRFIGGGGLQFVHGGAMPQEIIVPLIDYRRTSQADLVDVTIAIPKRVITSFRIQVPFYQEQDASPRYLPRTVKAAFYIDEQRISDEINFTMNLVGENHERRETFTFNLIEKYYPAGQVCTLRIMTIEDNKTTFYNETPFTIHMYNALY
ncbi:BREX-1 system phosphatase PglZ type A [Planomicrobium okeanokoites]|uniref:BREX-1 system phosphatase PglZ type A n=1 Tax=Planomicrobium okeanokoites TaxID=244 RepID=UPI00249339B7|nr:BREX-1 system phosphatase PglZ type A [Planomicrobium okeanokoites]